MTEQLAKSEKANTQAVAGTTDALEEFFTLLETTDVIKQVLKSLKEEPAHLLGDICREYKKTGKPVPDYYLNPVGYLGDAALKATLSLGLITRQHGGTLSLYSYEPTPKGLEQYEKLKAGGFYKRYPFEH